MTIKKSEFNKIVKQGHREFTKIVTASIPWFVLFTLLTLTQEVLQLPVAPLKIAGGFAIIIGSIGVFMYTVATVIGLTCSVEKTS